MAAANWPPHQASGAGGPAGRFQGHHRFGMLSAAEAERYVKLYDFLA